MNVIALANEDGQTVSLKDHRGKNLVLFFYPKASTSGLTLEACGFRDAFQKIKRAGAVVLGGLHHDYGRLAGS